MGRRSGSRIGIERAKRKISSSRKSSSDDEHVLRTDSGSGSSPHTFTADDTLLLRSRLLSWYDENKRDLPWRNKAEVEDGNIRAYSVWVSEVMLQQTQVATVIDYYNKWMKKWPTVQDLAAASLEEVNEVWSGLGYYSRAKNLHLGAKKVVSELDGEMPRTAAELMKLLPGVGQYTAGAIASIAFSQATGVVDGNVIRVFTRLRAIGASVGQKQVMDLLWSLANSSVSPDRPGDFNQALMELGATVCTPKQPQCAACPVSQLCKAKTQVDVSKEKSRERLAKALTDSNPGELSTAATVICDIEDCGLCCPDDEPWEPGLGVANYPRKPKKKAPREEKTAVLIPVHRNRDETRYLVTQRPDNGLLANLWEFPSQLVDNDVDSALQSLRNRVSELCGSSVDNVTTLGEVVHVFSHIHQTYLVHAVNLETKPNYEDTSDRSKWVTTTEFNEAGVSTAMRKVFKLFTKDHEPSKKKRKSEPTEDSKQVRLDSFFTKKNR